MQEKIEFVIYGLDRKNINFVKRSFSQLKTDEQTLIFCLEFVANNKTLVKHKCDRYSTKNDNKHTQPITQQNNAKINTIKTNLGGKND
jgi:hypothetical protein